MDSRLAPQVLVGVLAHKIGFTFVNVSIFVIVRILMDFTKKMSPMDDFLESSNGEIYIPWLLNAIEGLSC
jgi:hypothetical protein